MNNQIVNIKSIEIDPNDKTLIYGKHNYGQINIIGAFEYENNNYIIINENNSWIIKSIIIDDYERKTIINLNNTPFTYKTIDNIKFYLTKYGTLDQTPLNDIYLDPKAKFYATTNQKLFDYLDNLMKTKSTNNKRID